MLFSEISSSFVTHFWKNHWKSLEIRQSQNYVNPNFRAEENPVIADVIRNLVDTTQAPSDEKRTVDFPELLQNSNADLSKVNPLPKSEDFIDFLRKRALDDSVFVRKNALQVLENILKYYSFQQSQTKSDVEPITIELVSILSEHCR